MDAITVRIQTMEPASGLVTSGVTKPPSQLGYFQYENGVYPATALRARSEEHTSELQSLMRISYAVFCLKKKIIKYKSPTETTLRTDQLHRQHTTARYTIRYKSV